MAADEQQPQDVVAVVGAVEPLGERGLGVLEIGEHLLVRQRLLLRPAAHRVDRRVAADEDQPGGGIARRAVLRPVLQRPQAGVLEGLLGRVEIAEIAQQRRHRLRPGGGERRVDPGDVGHIGSRVRDGSTPIGRIS